MNRMLLKNALIVTKDDMFQGDLEIENGVISAIGLCGSFREEEETLDAAGRMVIPGLIDPHVHIKHPFKGTFSADDFYTATRSAIYGGVTSVIDFAIQWNKDLSLQETVENRKAAFAGESMTDYAVHACPTKSSIETIEELPRIIEEGTPSFKLYMTYSKQGRMSDDALLLKALEETARHPSIIGVHAENDAICCFNDDEFKRKGYTHPQYFPLSNPNIVEAEAINRAAFFTKSTGGTLYIFHRSTRAGLDILEKERASGTRIAAETCVHYLILDDSRYQGDLGERFICSPPLRSKKDQDALWEGIRKGTISVISTDHCGFSKSHKALGEGAFQATPKGLPGMELRLPLIYTAGVATGKISVNKMVELLCTNPAKIFGMYPQKGTIQVGSYADLTLVDVDKERTLSSNSMHSPVDWSPYEGMKLKGFATTTILRGKVVVDETGVKCTKGCGHFIPRKL